LTADVREIDDRIDIVGMAAMKYRGSIEEVFLA
jgi:hypothetical protein